MQIRNATGITAYWCKVVTKANKRKKIRKKKERQKAHGPSATFMKVHSASEASLIETFAGISKLLLVRSINKQKVQPIVSSFDFLKARKVR